LGPSVILTARASLPTGLRYREQEVDQLLQLTLQQALTPADEVPAGAMIMLAMGDGECGAAY